MSFKIVSIEGNIGNGKSTAIKPIKEGLEKNGYQVILMDEPVERWMQFKDENDKDILTLFYEDQKEYAFVFQMLALLTRFQIFREGYNQNVKNIFQKNIIFLTERTIHTDKHVFAKMLHESGKINNIEMQIYNNWFDDFVRLFPISLACYLRIEPELAFQRVQKRARKGEEIPIEYLISCHKAHEDFINVHMAEHGVPTFTIDNSFDVDSEEYSLNIETIVNTITKTFKEKEITDIDLVNKVMLLGGNILENTVGLFSNFVKDMNTKKTELPSIEEGFVKLIEDKTSSRI